VVGEEVAARGEKEGGVELWRGVMLKGRVRGRWEEGVVMDGRAFATTAIRRRKQSLQAAHNGLHSGILCMK
jgi:hypothetical protein